jgi:penicillin amidase
LRLLRAGRPAPWTPLDTAALVIYMDDRLTVDGDEELRAHTEARVGTRAATWILDVEPEGTPPIAADIAPGSPSEAGATPAGSSKPAALPEDEGLDRTGWLPPTGERAVGSNAWAVDARWTDGGGPLLCNDTHLMHALPALFHAFELKLPDRRMAGFAIPGAPLTVIGTNGALAWGVTTLYADAVDLLLESFADAESTRVVRGDGTALVTVTTERIRVRGQAAPDSLRVRWTDQGPLLPLDGSRRWATRRWARHAGGGTLAAMLRLQDAATLEAAHDALSTYAGPGQSFVLADTVGPVGRVGWVPAGRWPQRELPPSPPGGGPTGGAGAPTSPLRLPRQVAGALPRPGAAALAGMPSMAAFDSRPALLPAADGWVVTANHRAAGGDAGLGIAPRWPLPWRAMRLQERLRAERPWTAASMASLQIDPMVESARRFAGLLAHTPPPATATDAVRDWWTRLAAWDGAMAGDACPTLWRATMDRLEVEIFADDWPADVIDASPREWGARSQPLPLERAVLRVLGLLGGAPAGVVDDSLDARDWIDDQRTPDRETSPQILARALAWGLSALRERYGDDPADWRWDRVHTLTLEHPLAAVPVLGSWLRLGPAAVPGDRHAVCATAARDATDLAVDTIPIMRIVIDLGAPDQSRFVLSSGESEHPMSPWFGDQFPRWVRGEMLPLLRRPETAARGGHRLVLEPASPEREAS